MNWNITFLIADVSDKGVPAALFMMSVKNLINYRAHEGGTPGEILTSVNAQVCMNNEAMMFATVWMGILNEGDSIFLYIDGVTEAKNGSGEFYGPERKRNHYTLTTFL